MPLNTVKLNEEVLKLVEESPLTTIRTRQRNRMGHIMRVDSLQREIIEGREWRVKEEGEDQGKIIGLDD